MNLSSADSFADILLIQHAKRAALQKHSVQGINRMSAVHTPAPWAFERAVETDGSVTYDIFSIAPEGCNGVGCDVAYIQTYSAQQADVQEANARLIAAAPSLLAALEEFVAKFGECGLTENARAAITQATGVQS